MKVSVSILKEEKKFKEAIEKLNNTDCDYIHLDIMDNTFTNKTSFFKISDFFDIKTNKKYDVHIMSTNLEEEVNDAIKLRPEFITIHAEVKDYLKYLKLIKDNNIYAGIAINPETKIEEVKDSFKYANLVLVMGVVPGEAGQSFIEDTVEKLKELKLLNNNLVISVDGGINDKTINLVKDYTDMIVSGSFVTSSSDYQKSIDILRK